VCEPLLGGNELEYVQEAVRTGWISSAGSFLRRFETAFATYCGTKHATAVTNGTSAVHLVLKAIDIRPGDEVIIPDFTMISSAFPVCYLGATPVFVDAERETWNIDPGLIEEKVTEKTRAIMAVHIYGHPCDMDPILEVARRRGLWVVEDAAEVHGAEYHGRRCGNLGDIAAFSFFANKVVTTGEGGMVVTNDDRLMERCTYYKDLCFPSTGERTYRHEDIGFQYRMSNLQAAIGVAQMEKIDSYVEMRRTNNAMYRRFLHDVPGVCFQPERAACKNVYWMSGIVIDQSAFGVDRDNLRRELAAAGVQTRLFFAPMHRQPALERHGCSCKGEYPVADWLAANGMYLPSGSGLSAEDIEFVCGKIRDIQRTC